MSKVTNNLFDSTVFLFQGGGSLGAYQAGVVKGLYENGYTPDWVIGTSIGAVNSAIVAGNAPDEVPQQLENFWHSIASKMPAVPNTLNNIAMERWQHFLSAQYTANFGVPGFFVPRPLNPWLGIDSTADKLSYYDTSVFKQTLGKFIDFDRINDKKIRLSIGAVRIATGSLVYFDNTKIKITPEHVMASCALPPGFPAVEIDEQLYWDGGVHSNTQINLLLCEKEPLRYLCFMSQLFDSYGTRPNTMDDVLKRHKDITYSSHHKQSIYIYKSVHNLRHAIRILGEHLPPEKLNDPAIQKLISDGRTGIVHVARFHYKSKRSELSSKDYEFSLPSIKDRMKNGCADACRAMRNPPWMTPCAEDIGLVLHELSDTVISEESLFEEAEQFHSIT